MGVDSELQGYRNLKINIKYYNSSRTIRDIPGHCFISSMKVLGISGIRLGNIQDKKREKTGSTENSNTHTLIGLKDATTPEIAREKYNNYY